MLNRMQSGLTVKNPLLDDIRQEYGFIYQIIRKISSQLPYKFHLPTIDDDEASFITLYFARYIEQHPHPIRALLICTTGMGTSELLRTKVKRFFPEIYIVGTASNRSVTPEYLTKHRVELILTTVKLPMRWSVPTILVNTLFIDRDKQNVRQVLEFLHQEPKSNNIPLKNLPIMEISAKSTDKTSLFKQLLQQAPPEILAHETAIIAGLEKRELLGDTCIAPGIALAHAQLPNLKKSFFAMSLLHKPFCWDLDENFINILLMIIIPEIPDAESITFLHQLMKKLADDNIVKQLQDISSQNELRDLLFV